MLLRCGLVMLDCLFQFACFFGCVAASFSYAFWTLLLISINIYTHPVPHTILMKSRRPCAVSATSRWAFWWRMAAASNRTQRPCLQGILKSGISHGVMGGVHVSH
ncbi:hypothetical protein EJ02DRAFT_271229 [Clathrospora elynae]|uniref:Uncharacterized protein n=1 Tax=Clathrospora elynae TaxID=706981 RepID=A0A6A5SNJ2_9PLEO|nr:hypothetical protein EJ02DRAFT_271229 [Clathrospora elynae]